MRCSCGSGSGSDDDGNDGDGNNGDGNNGDGGNGGNGNNGDGGNGDGGDGDGGDGGRRARPRWNSVPAARASVSSQRKDSGMTIESDLPPRVSSR